MKATQPTPLVLSIGLMLICADATLQAADAVDPLEGKWSGKAGFPTDRIDISFEFKRNAEGGLDGYMYEHSYFGLQIPGGLKREGTKYSNKDWNLSLVLVDERIEGSFFSASIPMSLQRTERLPAEIPIPGLPNGPEPRWQVKLGGAIYAPAALRDGVAYVGTTTGLFHAVSLADGAFLWSFAAGRPIFGEALVTDEHVYFACDNGFLYKLQRATGKEVWRYDLGDARATRMLPHLVKGDMAFDFDIESPRPVLADGTLYVGSGDGSMHAVDDGGGARIWRFVGKGKVRTTAALDAQRVYVGTTENMLYGIERKSGTGQWEQHLKSWVTTSPVIVDNRLLTGVRNGRLSALDPATGEPLWRMGFWGSAVDSEIATAGNTLICIGSSDLRRVSLIDSKDGRVLWRTDVFGWAWSRPLVSGKWIYASTAGVDPYEIRHVGGLAALDRATGKLAWRWQPPHSSGAWMNGFMAGPAIEGRTLVVGSLDGSLYAFAVE